MNDIIENFSEYGNIIAEFSLQISPDIFPDEFIVEYINGDEEKWLSYALVGIDELVNVEIYSSFLQRKVVLDASSIEEKINLPGKYYKDGARAFRQFVDIDQCFPNYIRKLDTPNKSRSKRKVQEKLDNEFSCCPWYYFIYDEYTVLQLTEFSFNNDFESVVRDWNKMKSLSKSNKLILDVSNNGGGIVPLNQLVTKLMFPYISEEYLTNFINLPYNELIKMYLNVIVPLMEEDYTDDEITYYIENLDTTNLCMLEEAYEAFWSFYKEKFKLSYAEFLDPLLKLQEEKSVSTFRNMTKYIKALLIDFNPTTVVPQAADIYFNTTDDNYQPTAVVPEAAPIYINLTTGYINHEPELLVRGGEAFEFITKINLFTHEYVNQIPLDVRESVDATIPFDEYVILSNGLCGSSCDQLVTTSMQLWRNREKSLSKQPVTIVTYGGLGEKIDPSQWAAGFVTTPEIKNNFGPLFALSFFYDLTNETKFLDVADDYNSLLYDVPYFSNGWPAMPATEIISSFMWPSGVPIDYLKKTPDHYIPQIYKCKAPTECVELWTEASKFFVNKGSTIEKILSWFQNLGGNYLSWFQNLGGN